MGKQRRQHSEQFKFKVALATALLLCGLAGMASQPSVMSQTNRQLITSVAWIPDGSRIAVGYGSNQCDPEHPAFYIIEIVDTQSGQVIQTLTGALCDITSIDWSLDGSRVTAASLESDGVRV